MDDLRVVIPCVNYADLLAVTLPEWLKYLKPEQITVVTAILDFETLQVTEQYEVNRVATNIWYENGAKFDKARALDAAFFHPAPGTPCLSLDADVFPEGLLPRTLESGVIYGADRHEVLTQSELDTRYQHRLLPPSPRLDYKQHRKNWRVCTGSFQLFRWHEGLSFGSHPDAGFYDYRFALNFPRGEMLKNFRTYHLGPACKNWKGRVTGRWA